VAEARTDRRWLWLLTGFIAGAALVSIWPHEPLTASQSDRNEKFVLLSAPMALDTEAVFVLDNLTGRLTGAALGRTRNGTGFTNFFYANLAEDFKASGETYYAITAGIADIQNRGGAQWGAAAIYVAELSSGMVGAYAVPYRITQVPGPPVPLVPVATFPFRERTVTQ